MSDLDQLLRETLQREVPPAPSDPGVITEAVRQRVAAGDGGLSAGAAGPFARRGSGLLGWAGAGVLAVIVGGTAGVVGLPGQGEASSAEVPGVVQTVLGLDCPDGTPVVSFRSGERVLAVVRSADSAQLGVRSPFDRSRIVWVDADRVTLDDGSAPVSDLPEQDCAEAQAKALPADDETASPEPTTPTTAPTPGGPTAGGGSDDPDPDPAPNQAPRITALKVSGDPFCGGDQALIEVAATDDHQVTEVMVKWNGADDHDWVAMVYSGGRWRYNYAPPAGTFGNVAFTVRAYDAQDSSHAKSMTVYVDCLI